MKHKITAYRSIVENTSNGSTFLAGPLDEKVQYLNHENNKTEWVAELDVAADDPAEILRELYEKIKHGDEDHQKWLKDKIESFIEFKGF